jgi:post-segregation antitoxin (ccd killing protein)
MGNLKITAIRIDEDDLIKAKKLGINVSQVCRNAVKEAIRRMEGSYLSKDP